MTFAKDDTVLVVADAASINTYMVNDRCLKAQRVLIGKGGNIQNFLSVGCLTQSKTIVGTQNGCLYTGKFYFYVLILSMFSIAVYLSVLFVYF